MYEHKNYIVRMISFLTLTRHPNMSETRTMAYEISDKKNRDTIKEASPFRMVTGGMSEKATLAKKKLSNFNLRVIFFSC